MYLTSGSFTVVQWNNGTGIKHLGSSFAWQNLSKSVNKSIYSIYDDGVIHRNKDTHNLVTNNKAHLTAARLIIIFEEE